MQANDNLFLRLGVYRTGTKVTACFVSAAETADCGLLLYDVQQQSFYKKIPFQTEERKGNLWVARFSYPAAKDLCYCFYEGEQKKADPTARAFLKKKVYGEVWTEEDLIAVAQGTAAGSKAAGAAGTASGNEAVKAAGTGAGNEAAKLAETGSLPGASACGKIAYQLHLRGFTMDPSSKVAHPGTFEGLVEKIPYLKETGITTIEFQPIYEFAERSFSGAKVNYWGYQNAFYFAPKSAYAAGEDPTKACKDMIDALHSAGMEVILQFYFAPDFLQTSILEVLRYWAYTYQVDGFHILGFDLPWKLIESDPMLAKLEIWGGSRCSYHEGFLHTMRRFLKGDEGMLQQALMALTKEDVKHPAMAYLSNYNTFTLADTFAYETKHNEANGEENADGTNWNVSQNMGAEGPTSDAKILALRRQMCYNAYVLLLFSRSTPLLFMGDEFGNSQFGNNNPYCQDNEIAWLNWSCLEKNQEQYTFFKDLLALRKAHPILHTLQGAAFIEANEAGYPLLSIHGTQAWQEEILPYFRHGGILYFESKDKLFYLALNLHTAPHSLALPKLPKGQAYSQLLSTNQLGQFAVLEENGASLLVPPGSIVLLESKKTRQNRSKKRTR